MLLEWMPWSASRRDEDEHRKICANGSTLAVTFASRLRHRPPVARRRVREHLAMCGRRLRALPGRMSAPYTARGEPLRAAVRPLHGIAHSLQYRLDPEKQHEGSYAPSFIAWCT